MDIGSAIKSIRTRNKITQKDLAVKCGISANALCSIEKNHRFQQREQCITQIPISLREIIPFKRDVGQMWEKTKQKRNPRNLEWRFS